MGLDNIRQLGSDNLFWQSLKVTTIYTLASVPVGLVASFLLALLINTKVRGIALFRTVYCLPSIVPAVVAQRHFPAICLGRGIQASIEG